MKKKKHKYSENVYKCFPCSQFVYLVQGKMQQKKKFKNNHKIMVFCVMSFEGSNPWLKPINFPFFFSKYCSRIDSFSKQFDSYCTYKCVFSHRI